MMRILITTIALSMPGRIIPEGAVVEGVELPEGEAYGEDQIPLEIAVARLAAGTAEPVIDGVTSISPVASAAIAQLVASTQVVMAASLAFLDAAEAGSDSDKLALAEATKAVRYDLPEDLHDRMRVFRDQVDAIQSALATAQAEKPRRTRAKAGDPA